MKQQQLTAVGRAIVAGIALTAVITQFLYSAQFVTGFSAVNFFSFFTVESNLFAAVILGRSANFQWSNKESSKLDALRGAATLYMVITGIIYSLLLTGVDVQASVPWCNFVLHYAFPVVMLADWTLIRAKKALNYSIVGYWLIFPAVYGAYSLIRGPHAHHWYPYPFLNAATNGYLKVAMNAIIISLGFALLAMALVYISRFRTKTSK